MANKKIIKRVRYPKKKNKETLTLNQFLQNPTGKFSAFMARRDYIKRDMEIRYDNLLKRFKKYLKLSIYKDKDNYYFVFKMPSEEYGEDIFYDVVIKFIPPNKETIDKTTLTDYNINIFRFNIIYKCTMAIYMIRINL